MGVLRIPEQTADFLKHLGKMGERWLLNEKKYTAHVLVYMKQGYHTEKICWQ